MKKYLLSLFTIIILSQTSYTMHNRGVNQQQQCRVNIGIYTSSIFGAILSYVVAPAKETTKMATLICVMFIIFLSYLIKYNYQALQDYGRELEEAG